MTARGRFIVVEGGEGAGKTTQRDAVADWLRARGRPVVCTREPGGTPLAEAIRALLKQGAPGDIAPESELLLVFAARADHLQRVIRPALAAGRDVVCDRFVDASYAYQGAGRGIAYARIDALAQWICADTQPDCVLLLDLPVTTGRRRACQRGAADRFEQEDEAFAERIRHAYLERARQLPERYRIIDASAAPETVRSRIEAALEDCFGKA